jgi:membrane-associated PAP2 superfamily phosphatase
MRALRSNWLPEAILLFAIAIAATVIFGLTRLDIAAAGVFYHAPGTDHWPLGSVWPWSALYRLAPYITASLLALGLLGLLLGRLRKIETWRQNGIFLIFSIVIGPGLIVNAIFKDHWERPRPRDVVEFGGALHYSPPPWPGEGGGSFPCGHCSVGFLYAGGWWIWKRQRPEWARASLALGLVLGSALGVARMAAGAHFLSDVVWSAILALSLAHILYHHILRLSARERAIPSAALNRPVRPPGNRILTVLALSGAACVLIALFVTPHGRPFSTRVDLALLPQAPRVLEITARSANIDIVIVDFPRPQLLADGELHACRADADAILSYRGTRLDHRPERHGDNPCAAGRTAEDCGAPETRQYSGERYDAKSPRQQRHLASRFTHRLRKRSAAGRP